MEPHVLFEPTLKFRWLREWGVGNTLQQEVRVLRPSRIRQGVYHIRLPGGLRALHAERSGRLHPEFDGPHRHVGLTGGEWRDVPVVEVDAEDEPAELSAEAG